jgi:hypothetical protein
VSFAIDFCSSMTRDMQTIFMNEEKNDGSPLCIVESLALVMVGLGTTMV